MIDLERFPERIAHRLDAMPLEYEWRDCIAAISPPLKRIKDVSKLPDALRQLYASCDGIFYHWKARGNGFGTTGRINIPSQSQFWSRKTTDSVPIAELSDDPHMRERLARLVLLDDLGYGNLVLLDLADKDQPELCLYLCDDRLFELELGLEAYLQTTIRYAGIYLWQRYYARDYEPSDVDLDDHCVSLLGDEKLSELSLPPLPSGAPLLARFNERISRLRRAERETVELAYPCPIAALAHLQAHLGRRLPTSFLELYSASNGLEVEWSTSTKRGGDSGAIGINPLALLTGSRHGGPITMSSHDHLGRLFSAELLEEHPELGRVRPFEEWPGMHEYVALDFESPELQLYFVDVRAEDPVVPIPASFERYVEYLLRWLGAGNWVANLIEPCKQGDESVQTSLDRVSSVLDR